MQSTSILSLALLGLSLVTACSSGTTTSTSGSSGSSPSAQLGGVDKAKTCKNVSLNHLSTDTTTDPCNDCEATKCSVEIATTIGTDPAAFGGACGETLSCYCECDKTDGTCLAKCPPQTQACADALTAGKRCEAAKCATECNKDAG
jgi:hypothetical protein